MPAGPSESSPATPSSPPPRGLRDFLRRVGPAGILTLLAAGFPFIGFILVAGTILRLAPWLQAHGLWGLLIYVSIFWILGGLAFLPTWTHSALGGWTFGFVLGLPAALLSYLGASLIGYTIARHASGDRVTQLISEHPKWQAVYDALLNSGFWRSLLIVTLLRIPPNSPFAITNVIMAATHVPLIPFALGTMLGLAPRTAFVVYTAATIRSFELDPHRQGIWLILANLLTGALAIFIIVLLARHALARFTATHPPPNP